MKLTWDHAFISSLFLLVTFDEHMFFALVIVNFKLPATHNYQSINASPINGDNCTLTIIILKRKARLKAFFSPLEFC